MMIRLYGHMKGSFRTVTLGLEQAFQELGVLEGTYHGENVEFEDGIGGADAPIAVVTGDPMRVLMAHYHGSHREKWLMLAPNSEGIPPLLKEQLKGEATLTTGEKVPMITGLLAPSRWAEDVLRREFPDHPVIHCPHGVLPVFRMESERREFAAQLFDNGTFRVLHVTSSRMKRKGTRELIHAWKQVHPSYPKSKLDIMVNPEFLSEFQDYVERADAADCVQVIPGQNFWWDDYARGIQAYAFVVQPSRAEGFGLVPLEARACGIPTVLTTCTGHLEYIDPRRTGMVTFVCGRNMESDDFPGAVAPCIDVITLKNALLEMLKYWKLYELEARASADRFREEWTWTKKAVPAVEQLKKRISL